MKDKITDGGPAFPAIDSMLRNDGIVVSCSSGMSLRDYFAAAALFNAFWVWRNCLTEEDVARNAYRVADAMLKARENNPTRP